MRLSACIIGIAFMLQFCSKSVKEMPLLVAIILGAACLSAGVEDALSIMTIYRRLP